MLHLNNFYGIRLSLYALLYGHNVRKYSCPPSLFKYNQFIVLHHIFYRHYNLYRKIDMLKTLVNLSGF